MKLTRIAPAPVACILLSTALFFQAGGLNEIAQPGQLGPGFWPRLVLIGLALACAAKLIVDVRCAYGERGVCPAPRPPVSRARLVAGIAFVGLYVLLAPFIGFTLATVGFITAFMWLSGARSVPMIAGNVVVGTVLLLYVFIKFVYLPLPKGDGLFESFTLALYRALHLF
ncbi:MAG: tripartite tricarboxylate transporter TctB family protein [Desulfobacterales bacterium]|nr:tripartite tricarboxylate transporter TctB family protein [Desulfobacterales bacterium]